MSRLKKIYHIADVHIRNVKRHNEYRQVFENYKKYTDKAKRQAFKSKNEFSWDKMADQVDELLAKYVPEFPQEVELKLPAMKKIEIPKLKKLNTNG